jgi:hypothetical protein
LDASIDPDILSFLTLLGPNGKFISILVGTFRFDVLLTLLFVFLGISPLPINALILGDPILPIFFGLLVVLIDLFFLTFIPSLEVSLTSEDSFFLSGDFCGEGETSYSG